MEENGGPWYFNDDGTEVTPDLYPTPDLCDPCLDMTPMKPRKDSSAS